MPAREAERLNPCFNPSFCASKSNRPVAPPTQQQNSSYNLPSVPDLISSRFIQSSSSKKIFKLAAPSKLPSPVATLCDPTDHSKCRWSTLRYCKLTNLILILQFKSNNHILIRQENSVRAWTHLHGILTDLILQNSFPNLLLYPSSQMQQALHGNPHATQRRETSR